MASPERPLQPLVSTPLPPATYAFADETCQQGPPPEQMALTDAQIWSWAGPKVEPRQVRFHDAHSGPDLSSAAIHTTTAGAVYQRSCATLGGNDFSCAGGAGGSKGWALTQPGSTLRLCRDARTYERQSVEGIALTSLYFIQAARDRYLEVTQNTQTRSPEAIALSVLPAFITDFEHPKSGGEKAVIRTFITDNLAYFPDAQMIAVFPVKAAERAASPGSYWESGFVLGHEYGHHIDFTRHGRVLTSVGLTWNPYKHGFSDELGLASGLGEATGRAQMAGAEAEAFADLLGYYTTGASSSSISGLVKIGENRDVARSKFHGGAEKVLTKLRLEILLGHDDGSADPAFVDIHTAGAVLAYTANEVFGLLVAKTSTLAAGSTAETDLRYHLTLVFMDTLTSEIAKLAPLDQVPDITQPVAYAFEQATTTALAEGEVKANAGELQAAVCRLAQQRLPAVLPAPFALGGHCS